LLDETLRLSIARVNEELQTEGLAQVADQSDSGIARWSSVRPWQGASRGRCLPRIQQIVLLPHEVIVDRSGESWLSANNQVERRAAALPQPKLLYQNSSIPSDAQRS
jgi:hypothetical protein